MLATSPQCGLGFFDVIEIESLYEILSRHAFLNSRLVFRRKNIVDYQPRVASIVEELSKAIGKQIDGRRRKEAQLEVERGGMAQPLGEEAKRLPLRSRHIASGIRQKGFFQHGIK